LLKVLLGVIQGSSYIIKPQRVEERKSRDGLHIDWALTRCQQ
jgi:hypothetical protein